jgi:hypothetical protein
MIDDQYTRKKIKSLFVKLFNDIPTILFAIIIATFPPQNSNGCKVPVHIINIDMDPISIIFIQNLERSIFLVMEIIIVSILYADLSTSIIIFMWVSFFLQLLSEILFYGVNIISIFVNNIKFLNPNCQIDIYILTIWITSLFYLINLFINLRASCKIYSRLRENLLTQQTIIV